MSLGSDIGGSAASGAIGGFFGGMNSFLRQGMFTNGASSLFGSKASPWVTSALGGGALVGIEKLLGGALKDDDKYQDERSYALASRLADLQYQYQQRSLRESPTNYRYGLVAAGYNPILAFNGGQMSSPMPQASNAQTKPSPETQIAGVSSIAAIGQAEAALKAAEAADKNATTNEWVIYDAQSLGTAGFEVMGYGASGQHRTIQSIRINKVTGEVFDALTGEKIRVMGSLMPDGKSEPTTEPSAKGVISKPSKPSVSSQLLDKYYYGHH